MDSLIFIQNDLIDKIDDDELCVYLSLKYIAKQNIECFITHAHIDYVLFGRESNSFERRIIASGFKKNIDKQRLFIIKNIRDYGYVCNTENLNVYRRSLHYTSIDHSELQKIMSISGCNRYSLLRYFIILISTFAADKKMDNRYRFKVGYMPRTHLSTMAGIDVSTVDKYNKVLEENSLIYISRRRCYGASKGTPWQTNIYSRYQDKELCEHYAEENSTIVDAGDRKRQTNDSRRYVQMYNAMLKGKVYDKNTVAEIYRGIIAWNEDKKQKYEKQTRDGFSPIEPAYKDLSVFDNYELD
jgi:hypothetical protein